MSTSTEIRDTGALETSILDLHRRFLSDAGAAESPLTPLRKSAAEKISQLKFPHSTHELFTYVGLKDLVGTPFALKSKNGEDVSLPAREHIYPGCEQSHFVLVDGVFRPELTAAKDAKGVSASYFEEALNHASLREYLESSLAGENDIFAAINTAFAGSGLFLDIPDQVRIEQPIQIINFARGDCNPVMVTPRILVRLGAHAEAKLILKHAGAGPNYFNNSAQDFILGENSSLKITQTQAEDPESWHFSKTRAHLFRNSRLSQINAFSGSRLTRYHGETRLRENGAEFDLKGISVLRLQEQVHNYVTVRHEAGSCASRLHFRNIVSDRSRASVDGTVTVCPGAQLTHSDQLINNLMLSDSAHADSKPNLMIYADDVKCTHGSTVGQIDDEQLFYLRTRGLSLSRAKTLLTTSFADAIIKDIEYPAVAAALGSELLKKMEAENG